ncbi:MAG: response regulator transcription factor [Candidatus Polarisedimenticolia bacterium]
MAPMRVLLVDENDDYLNVLAAWLTESLGLHVVGRAASASEAFHHLEASAPEVVVMDATLPDMSGFEAARSMASRPQAPWIVLMAFHDTGAFRSEAAAAGAAGCVSKIGITDQLSAVLDALPPRDGLLQHDHRGKP